MQEGVNYFLGYYDFIIFCLLICQVVSFVKILDELCVECVNMFWGFEVYFYVCVCFFLYNQVCSFVGILECVGVGSWIFDDVKDVFEVKDWVVCGLVCLLQGLYLVGVDYLEDFFGNFGDK